MLSPVLTVSIFQKQSDPKVFSAGQVIFKEGEPGGCPQKRTEPGITTASASENSGSSL